MELEVRKYENYSRDIKRLLIVSGIWPNFYPVLQRFVAVLAICCTAMTFMGAFNFCLEHVSNVVVLTRGMGLLFTLLSTGMKVILIAAIGVLKLSKISFPQKICVFLHHQKDLIHLNQHLSARFLDDLQNKAYQSHVLARLPAFSELFYSLTYTIGSTAFLTTILIPLLALRHGKYIQVCPSIFPFEYAPGGLVYWLLQLTEALAAFFVWAVTSGVDSAFGLYTLQMCGELRILGSKFESLRVSDKYREELRECIERHHLLMKARDSMEKTFGLLAIWLAVSSAVIQCTLVFQAMEVAKSMNPLRIGFFFLYIVLKLLQAFMYAWYGNLIAEESAMCLNAIYNARWAGCGNSRFMTDVLIILSQKPLVFTAKGCVSLSRIWGSQEETVFIESSTTVYF